MQTQSYNHLWQKIHQSARYKGFPLRVMFELTYRCNFYCRHCYVPLSYRKYKELKTKEVFSILDQLADLGCFYLGFTGGEPFLRKDILPILWYAKKKGFQVIIYTNGSLINENIARELKNLSPNKVDITIPAMSESPFRRITGVSGAYKKVFRGIELLRKNNINLGFKTCVLKENSSQIKDIEDFASSLGALHRLDDLLNPCLDGSVKPYRYRVQKSDVRSHPPSLKALSPLSFGEMPAEARLHSQEPCQRRTTASEGRQKSEVLFKCGVGLSQAAITPAGELKMCVQIDYPKYKISTEDRRQMTDLKSAWERLKKLVSSIKPNGNYQCNKCRLEAYCKWCPGRGWLYNRSFTSCEPESRKNAQMIRQWIEVTKA